MPRKVEPSVPTRVMRRGVSAVVRRTVRVEGAFNEYPIEHSAEVAPGDMVTFGFLDDAKSTLALYVNDERVWSCEACSVDDAALECWIEEPNFVLG